ncbi:hypothetical protein [Micromonospora sp. NPDC003776]
MTSPGAASPRPVRPGTVAVAYWLQLATVAVLLALLCVVVVEAVRYDALIDDVLRQVPDADPAEVSAERSGNLFTTLFLGIPALLLAGWLAATALPLRRGSNVARVLVFVAACGQLLLCIVQGCGGLLIVPLVMAAGMGDPEFGPAGSEGPDGDWEQSRFLDTLYSRGDEQGVVTAAAGGIGVLLVLALTVAVVVLLLLPESRRWFRGDVPTAAANPWPAYGYGYYGPGHPQPGQPVWLPPGYLLCPDPALHLAHPPAGAMPAGPPSDPTTLTDAGGQADGTTPPDRPGQPPAGA